MAMLLYKSKQKIKAVSKDRQKSLIFRISGALREVIEFEPETAVTVEVWLDETTNKKVLKIYEMD